MDNQVQDRDAILISLLRALAAGQLSLRDRIAIASLHAQITRNNSANADYAYRLADEMLAARMRPPPDDESDDDTTTEGTDETYQ